MTDLTKAKSDLENYQKHLRNEMFDKCAEIAKQHGMYRKPHNIVMNEIRLFIKELESEI